MCNPHPAKKGENTVKNESAEIPYILKPWVFAYRSAPKLLIPFTDVDIFFSVICAVIFSIIRVTFRQVLCMIGWPAGAPDTLFAAACMTSFCHSSLILPGLAGCLYSQKYVPCARMDESPQWWQDAAHSLISYCTGYMIYDSVMGYVVETWQPGVGPVLSADDWTYLGHHICTSLYMLSCRIAKAGHMSAMGLMFNGEFTAPVFNLHLTLEKTLMQESFKHIAWLQNAFMYNEQLFSFLYVVARVCVSPFVLMHLSYDLIFTKKGRKNVPIWLTISWMPMCWAVQIFSYGWILECVKTLKRGPALNIGHDEL